MTPLDLSPEAEAELRGELQRIVMYCAQFDPNDINTASELDADVNITSVINDLFSLLAVLLTSRNPWIDDQDHPGYAVLRSETGTMAAPFHLVAYLPTGDTLAELQALATTIKVGETSAICLSGSAVLLEEPHYFGDLDFCEYIPLNERDGSLDRLAEFTRSDRMEAICIEIKLHCTKIERPWPLLCDRSFMTALFDPNGESASGKADVITVRNLTGPVEATNVMIWTKPTTPDDGAATLSFPFQEVDVGTASVPWIPRQLARPSNIARYVRFLKKDITKYIADRPVKALKRALSLAAFLLLPDQYDAMLDLGQRTDAFEAEAIRQRRDLISRVTCHEDESISKLAQELNGALDAWTDGQATERHQRHSEAFTKQATSLVEGFLRNIDIVATGA